MIPDLHGTGQTGRSSDRNVAAVRASISVIEAAITAAHIFQAKVGDTPARSHDRDVN
jgi:hypothetical protein